MRILLSLACLLTLALPTFADDDLKTIMLALNDIRAGNIEMKAVNAVTSKRMDAIEADQASIKDRLAALETKAAADPFAVVAQKPASVAPAASVPMVWQCGPGGCSLVPAAGYAPAPEARQFAGWVCIGKDSAGSIWYQQIQANYGSCASGSCGVSASGGCASCGSGGGRGRRGCR